MYQLKEESLERFILSMNNMLEGLRQGPFWLLMKDNPNFKQMISDFEEIAKQVVSQTKKES